MNRQIKQPQTKQSGATLIVSLLILLVMTLLGVTAMQTNILEEKMAGNDKDRSLSLQAAEATLRFAEAEIEAIVSPAAVFDGGTAGYYPDDDDVIVDVFAAATWSAANSAEHTDYTANVTSSPRYIIELIGDIGTATVDPNINNYGESSGSGTVNSFRITARGTGGSDDTVTLLQAHYAKRF